MIQTPPPPPTPPAQRLLLLLLLLFIAFNMASLPSNQYGFPLVAVKEEVEDPGFHISRSLHHFPTRQEGTHAMMMASSSSSRAGGNNDRTLQRLGSGLPMPHSNAVWNIAQTYATGIHYINNLVSNLSRLELPVRRLGFQDPISRSHRLSIGGHSAIPTGPRSDGDGRGNTEGRELFGLKLTYGGMQYLNRLIIPAQPAKRFFPDAPYLMFWDEESRRWWIFQYRRSSCGQRYAFVSGWSSFAKEKALKPDDTLIFKAFTDNEILENCYHTIDVRRAARKKEQIKLFGAVIEID